MDVTTIYFLYLFSNLNVNLFIKFPLDNTQPINIEQFIALNY